MFKVSRKIVQDEFDSADELDDSMEDDVISFQKIPATQTKLNAHLFSAPSHAQEGLILKDVQNSLQPQSHHHQAKTKKTGAKSFQGEPIKQKNYNSIPQSTAKQQVIDTTPVSMKSSSPYSKTYSHLVDKENVNYEEQNNFITSNFENPPESSAYTELANKIYSEKFLSNSQARKTNVAKSAGPHLLLSPDEARKIEEKRYLGSRELQENVVNRLTNNANQNQSMEHSRIRENSYIDKNTEECTFTPSIIRNKPRRELSQFLDDQKQFQDQSQAKIKKKQEEIQNDQIKQEPTYKPEICANSKRILAKKQKEKTPVYQRLYNVGKNAQAKHMQGIAEREDFFSNRDSLESSQFIGQINSRGDLSTPTSLHGTESLSFIPTIHKKSKKIVRDDKVENLLYYDALRRQHKVVENSKNTKKPSSVAPLSSASKRAVATRFIKEFDIGILEFLEIDREPKLNYLQLNEFLKKLCFLKESEYIENPHFTPERLLLYDMWYILRADQYKGVHRRNLLMMLLAVMDLYFPITKIQKFDETNRDSQDNLPESENPEMAEMCDQYGNPVLPEEEGFVRERKNIGMFDEDGNLELNEDEVRKVHKVFELWYINRMCSADNIGQLIKLRNYEEPSHQPRINESSKRLAQNYREKMLGGTAELIQQNKIPAPKDGKLTHADLLIISKKISTEKVNKFGELLEEEKNRGCTFKPHITQYDSTQSMSSVRSPNHSRRQAGTPVSQASKNRVFELYSLAKPRLLKQDKNAEEHDFEKNYQECTFQPNVNLKREKAQKSADLYVKGIDKTVERMRQARAEREQKNNQLQRGFTTGKEGHFVFTKDKKKFSGIGSPFDQYALMRRNYPGESYQGEYEEEMYDYENHHHPGSSTNEVYNQAQVMRGDDNQDTHPYTTTYEQQTLDSRNYDYNKDERQSSHHTNQRHPEIAELGKDEDYEHEEEERNEEEDDEEEEGEEENHGEGEDDGRVPLLFVDVNLGQGRTERIIVYEGDSPEELAQKFSEEHNLDISMKGRLIELLDSQIAGLLSRIDEEATSNHSETDRQKYNENFGQFDQIQEEDDYND